MRSNVSLPAQYQLGRVASEMYSSQLQQRRGHDYDDDVHDNYDYDFTT